MKQVRHVKSMGALSIDCVLGACLQLPIAEAGVPVECFFDADEAQSLLSLDFGINSVFDLLPFDQCPSAAGQ